MATKATPSLLRAVSSFIGEVDGQTFQVREGDLIEDGHPLVKKHPSMFGPPVARFKVEQATAAPGEARK